MLEKQAPPHSSVSSAKNKRPLTLLRQEGCVLGGSREGAGRLRWHQVRRLRTAALQVLTAK